MSNTDTYGYTLGELKKNRSRTLSNQLGDGCTMMTVSISWSDPDIGFVTISDLGESMCGTHNISERKDFTSP